MKPVIKWAQDNNNIYVKIEVVPDNNDTIFINNNLLNINTLHFSFCLDLCYDVHDNLKITKSRHYNIVINKKEQELYWDYLIKNMSRNDRSWIQIDWEIWKDKDDLIIKKIEIPTIEETNSDEESDISLHSSSGDDDDNDDELNE